MKRNCINKNIAVERQETFMKKNLPKTLRPAPYGNKLGYISVWILLWKLF